MAQNKELENVVLRQLYNYLSKTNPTLKIMAEGDSNLGKEFIRMMANTTVDQSHKLRVHMNPFIAYGYDFARQSEDGESARQIYERATKNTKEMWERIKPNCERLIVEGVEDDRFGWYITTLDGMAFEQKNTPKSAEREA